MGHRLNLQLISLAGLSLLGACQVYAWHDCEPHPTPIAEDDDRIGISPGAALLVVEGPFSAPGQLDSGEEVEVSISVERVEGRAMYIRSEPVERRERRPSLEIGWGSSDVGVICRNSVEIPTRLHLRTDDGSIDLEAKAPLVVTDPSEEERFPWWPAIFDREWPAREAEDIPHRPGDLAPDVRGRQRPDRGYVQVEFDLEGQVRGELGWQGQDETDDFITSWGETVLEWGLEEEDTGTY